MHSVTDCSTYGGDGGGRRDDNEKVSAGLDRFAEAEEKDYDNDDADDPGGGSCRGFDEEKEDVDDAVSPRRFH